MKILILSASTGGGHNAAATALVTAFKSMNIPTTFLDILEFASPKASHFISHLYSHTTVRTPGLFGLLYKAGASISTPRFKSIIYRANILYTKKLTAYLVKEHIDAVICTHLFPAQAMTYIQKHHKLSLKTYAVATDYTCIPFWEDCEMDHFFIPHETLMDEFISHGVLASTLVPIGIPIHPDFLKTSFKWAAKKTLNLDPSKPLISIMCGSMGFGNITSLIDTLLKDLPHVQFFIVCGHNDTLYEELSHMDASIRVEKFIDYSPLLMSASDILLTKPGGLTSTEAAVSGTPLVHLSPIPGCETCNKAFFNEHLLSLDGDTPEKALQACKTLLKDDLLRGKILHAQKYFINHNSTQAICQFILSHH